MTYREAAKILGISPASLSLILNNKPGISQEMRERVLGKIDELGMNDLCKRVRGSTTASKKQGNIGFMIYKKANELLEINPFFLLIVENMEAKAKSFGYDLSITIFQANEPLKPQIEKANAMNVGGFIIFATEMEADDLDVVKNIKKPLVMLDNDFSVSDVSCVSINNRMGTYKAIEYLASLGHKEVGYLKCRQRISSFRERHAGYKQAANELNLKWDERNTFVLPYTEEESYRVFLKELDAGRIPPSALISDDDSCAFGAIRALKERGYRVPEDVSVIGYGDRPVCMLSQPKLTTINIPKNSFGVEAVSVLLKKINGNSDGDPLTQRSRKVRIGTYLIVRDSAAAPRRN